MRAIALAAIVLVLPAHVYADDYFPVHKGSKWVYVSGDSRSTHQYIIEVVDTRKDGTKTIVTMTATDGDEVRKMIVEVDSAGVHQTNLDGESFYPRLTILSDSLKAGSRWRNDVKAEKHSRVGEWICFEPVTIRVPAGEYKAVPVVSVSKYFGDDTIATGWYAPGIGLVKQVLVSKGSSITRVLKSYTPGQ